MYGLEIKPEADRIFKRLSKKDKHHLQRIYNKIREIQENPQIPHKFLHSPLQNYNSPHIGHFVLIFKINHKQKTLTICYYAHHDSAYKWLPKY